MYNPYFHFSCSPFENNLNQQFLYFSEGHDEIIASLLYFIQQKKSFALVSGDVGTGKTMLIHHLLGRLPGSVEPILIPYADVEYIEILRYIARIIKVNPEGKRVLDLIDDIKVALTKACLHGQQVVLIIDEAHLLSIGSLEHIRLLSNIEITSNKLLQILLIGQNELRHKLRRREMRQLRQRINVNLFLSPMSRTETIEYIDHRLRVAGSGFDTCFESECKKLIYKITGGVPRNINLLCDTALLICMTEKGDKVTERVLKKAHDALHSDVAQAPKESKSGRFFSVKKFSAEILQPALAAGVLVFVLTLGFLGYKGNLVENLKGWIYGPGSPKAVNTLVERPLPPVSEFKNEEISKPPGAEENSPSSSKPDSVTPQTPGPELKSEDISKPPEAEEKSASASMPGLLAPQTPGPVQESPEVLSKEDEPVGNIDVKVIDKASPSVEESASPAPPEEIQAKDQIPSANGESTQADRENVDEKVSAKSENPNADTENLLTGGRSLRSSDSFTITVQKGDTLREIAAQWFPEDPAAGETSILSANPRIHNKNRLFAGQILRIPLPKETEPEKQ
jgi:general secretion pathway protein A